MNQDLNIKRKNPEKVLQVRKNLHKRKRKEMYMLNLKELLRKLLLKRNQRRL